MKVSPDVKKVLWQKVGNALLFLAIVICAAGLGASWNRTHAVTLTMDDALRILTIAGDDSEREQALAAVARRHRELTEALLAEEKRRGRCAKYATIHLDRCDVAIGDRSK